MTLQLSGPRLTRSPKKMSWSSLVRRDAFQQLGELEMATVNVADGDKASVHLGTRMKFASVGPASK